MYRKIFLNMLSVTMTVLILCVLSISYILYGYFGEIIEKELRTEAKLISQGMDNDGKYLEKLSGSENRITLISPDGTVIFDSWADEGKMENHSTRREIKEAQKEGTSTVTRYSDTLAVKTIYYAKELKDGNILRIAQEQSMAILLLKGIVMPLLGILLVALILAAFISKVLSSKIITPVNSINLDDEEAEEPYPELAPLIKRIREQKKRIRTQINEIEREQREFRTITENMSEGFLVIDKKLDILSCNQAALNLLGDGNTANVKNAFELNRDKTFRNVIEDALSGKHSQGLMEKENSCYSIMASPAAEDGAIVGAVIIAVDVTEKERRDKLRREFTSNVSHELKTPLTTIYGVSDMIAEGIVKDDDIKSFAGNIKDESGRMIGLIDDIIKLSRLDENYVDEGVGMVNLYDIAKVTSGRLVSKADENKINITVRGEDTFIKATPSLCEEIIFNLLENAVKYNKENGSVNVFVRNTNDRATLTVEDTGIGIPYEYRERIFERFFRADKSHSRKIEGTGLGLSIVKHAVLHLGGRIEVDSKEGEGSKITVSFPRIK